MAKKKQPKAKRARVWWRLTRYDSKDVAIWIGGKPGRGASVFLCRRDFQRAIGKLPANRKWREIRITIKELPR